jgi:hypothetical protein
LKSSLPSGPDRTRSLYTLPRTDTAITCSTHAPTAGGARQRQQQTKNSQRED